MSSKASFIFPKTESSQIVFEESIFKIQRDILKLPDQPNYNYYSLVTKKFAVNILAQTEEGLYVLVKEYRHPTGQAILGCPGGYIDRDDESPLEAAARELKEETGYEATHFELLGASYPCPGITGQKTFYVKATGAYYVDSPQLETSEIIQISLQSKEDLNRDIQKGAAVDGNLCTALFFEQCQVRTILN